MLTAQTATPPGTRQDRRRRRTRGALYQAALQLFEENGFEATTVADIAERADAGKGTFFHHFPTKDHVLVAYWNEFNARLLSELERIRKRTARARLLAAMEIAGRAAKSEPEVGRVLLGRFFVSAALLDSDRDNERRLSGWLSDTLQVGIDRGELRADADVESLLFLIIASMSATFRDYVLSGTGDPVALMKRRMSLLLASVEVS